MVKFKKIGSSAPKSQEEEVASTDSEVDVKPAVPRSTSGPKTVIVGENILEFLEERFLDKYQVRSELNPDAVPFDPEEEDVYLLQVPKSYDVQGLIGKKINLEKKTKLGASGEKNKSYEILNKRGHALATQVVAQVTANGRATLTAVQPKGVLVLREALKDAQDEGLEEFLKEFDEAENGIVEVPRDLKVRHPLLGYDYEKDLSSIAERVKQEGASPKKGKKRRAGAGEKSSSEKRRKEGLETAADLQWLENI